MTEDPNGVGPREGRLQFDWRQTVRRAFTVLQDRREAIASLALALVVAPLLLIQLLSWFSNFSTSSFMSFAVVIIVMTLIYLVVNILFSAIVIQMLVPEFWGERLELKEASRTVLSRIWPLLGISLMAGLAISVGFAFLIVPGFFLLCAWYVFLPVVIGEQRGVFASLERSWELTDGYRLFVFAIVTALALVILVLEVIFFEISSTLSGIIPFASPIFGLMNSVVEAVYMSVSAALIGSVYYELLKVQREIDNVEDRAPSTTTHPPLV